MVQRNDESELIAMVDIRDKSELGMEAFEGVPFFNSIEDLMNSGLQFDVVNISVQTGLHSDQAPIALSHSHHVVCENRWACLRMVVKVLSIRHYNIQNKCFV